MFLAIRKRPISAKLHEQQYFALCCCLIYFEIESGAGMENQENTINKVDKVTETLIKELESLSDEDLHEFFMFFYKINHQHGNMITVDEFEEFLETFDNNPFKVNVDKKFRKQLIDNVVKYTYDHMSLLTAAVLIKKKFTVDEIVQNYYANVDVFGSSWY
ncbi:MAG: hypothetical protein J6C22_10970 [Bacteroides sp.]|nr:hypothetical protein [Bacteroides sp.]